MTATARTRTDPRISRRRRAIARSKRRRSIASVATVAVTATGLWVAFWSPLLAVDRVAVVGARHVSSADVEEVTGLGASHNLLLVSTGEIEEQVETLPWVAAAKVDRLLPGTVRVRVTERRPSVVLVVGDDRWLLDRGGHVLERASAGETKLPVLAGAAVAVVEEGRRVPDEEVGDALVAWRSLDGRLRDQVVGVLAPTSERISFSLEDGTQIRFGAAEALRAKNEVLSALLTQMKAEGRSAAYIDVRVPTSPAISNTPPVSSATPTPTPSA
jgi:cell division protein FtsQ